MNPDWVLRISAVFVGTVLIAVTAILAAFLTPFAIGTTPIPISWVITVAGIVAGIWVTGYGSGVTLLTGIPALAWFGVMLTLSSKTSEGDLPVVGNWVGYGLLLIGMAAIIVTIAAFVTSTARRIS
ncbi:hypothetical protein [Cryptosporangium sp. NPDC051539]|uniref:hypothetical protein n=1 Tax=Cryptosporangium sp. NPDC051539 TaxID=3363962 RepID=UPI003798F3EE